MALLLSIIILFLNSTLKVLLYRIGTNVSWLSIKNCLDFSEAIVLCLPLLSSAKLLCSLSTEIKSKYLHWKTTWLDQLLSSKGSFLFIKNIASLKSSLQDVISKDLKSCFVGL